MQEGGEEGSSEEEGQQVSLDPRMSAAARVVLSVLGFRCSRALTPLLAAVREAQGGGAAGQVSLT